MPLPLRRGAAALLLLLAGAAAGCGQDFSLAPFAGVKDPITAAAVNVNGLWSGGNSSGGSLEFQVASDTVASMTLVHVDASGCVKTFKISDNQTPVLDQAFTMDLRFEIQGGMVLSATFIDSSTCLGSYTFEGLAPAGTCSTSGSARFVAYKAP